MFERHIPVLATLLAILIASVGVYLGDPAGSSTLAPWTQTTAENPTGSYRFTNQGWQDSTKWRPSGEDTTEASIINQVHPLVWSLMVILVAFGLAILVTDDSHVERLWSKSDPAT